jgi:hypothetical protein
LGGLLFSTYYYYFLIGGCALILRTVLKLVLSETNKPDLRWHTSALLTLAGSAIFSAPYWFPLLRSMWLQRSWTLLQNRYFIPEFSNLHLPFLEFSVAGFVLLLGLVHLIATFRKNRVSLGLLTLLAGAYAWQLVAYVAFLAGTPLLVFKAWDFVVYILGVAAAFMFADLFLRIAILGKYKAAMVAALIVLPFYYGQQLVVGLADNALLSKAISTQAQPEFVAAYKDLHSDELLGRVVLADNYAADLAIYLPVYEFLPWASVFSHPAGDFYSRWNFLQKLSTLEDPNWFAAALMNNRYSRIDEMILVNAEGGYSLSILHDNFPNGTEFRDVFYPQGLFNPTYFSISKLEPFTVITPTYTHNPLATLPDYSAFSPSQSIEGIGDGDDLYQFLLYFEGDLDFPNKEAYLIGLSELYAPRP